MKLFRVESETINFSLVVPDNITNSELRAEVRSVGHQIADQQQRVLEKGRWMYSVSQADDEEEDATTMLGHLVADYYRSGGVET